jgi:hypothetical protein
MAQHCYLAPQPPEIRGLALPRRGRERRVATRRRLRPLPEEIGTHVELPRDSRLTPAARRSCISRTASRLNSALNVRFARRGRPFGFVMCTSAPEPSRGS